MNYKQKNRILLIGLVILLLASYQFSFKKTFELSSELKTLKKDKETLDNAGGKLNLLQQQNRYLDSVLTSKDLLADQSFQQNLLQKVNGLREEHKLKIVSLEEPHEFKKDGGLIQTYVIEVKGDFRNLMLFSSSLEQLRLGTFLSVDFFKKQNYKTRRKELICKIVLQRLSK